MKNRLPVSIMLVFLSVFFASCERQVFPAARSAGSQALEIQILKRTETFYAPFWEAGREDNVYTLAMTFSLLSFSGNAETVDYLNDYIYAGLSCEEYMEYRINHWKDAYSALWDAAQPDRDGVYWTAENTGVYMESHQYALYKDILSIEVNAWEFSGGAHGIGTTWYYLFDLAELTDLIFEDFFMEGSWEKLDAAVRARLQDISLNPEYQPPENLPKPDSFTIDEEGFRFVWKTPYRIASYVYGVVEIALPFHETEEYLTGEGINLIARMFE